MTQLKIPLFLVALLGVPITGRAELANACADFTGLSLPGVEITKAELIPAGTMVPPPYPGAPSIGPLPTHCRVDGVINRRKGVGNRPSRAGILP